MTSQPSLLDPSNPPTLSVSQFLDFINETIGVVGFSVQGEITGWKVHPSGVYFSLKDKEDGSLMDCYLSPYAFRGMGIAVEDGLEVKVNGAPSIYKPKGKFSFRVETMELVGEGSLKKAYDLLKKKLEEEGLFDRKRKLPEFVTRVGVVTSRTGAVIDDFRKNLAKLGLHIYLYDVRVEGTKAVDQITKAIHWFNKNMPDLDALAVMRGGGSLEDLQPFNNEIVARALFASKIPTIGAIGHDRDVPIAALVADSMTSTPTAAAMLINHSWDRLTTALPEHERNLVYNFENLLSQTKSLIDAGDMAHLFRRLLDEITAKARSFETYLQGVDPGRNLKLGYSIIMDAQGKVLKDATKLTRGKEISARLAKGSFTAKVEDIND